MSCQIKKINLFATPVLQIKTTDWNNKKQKLLSLVDWDNPKYKNDEQVSDYYYNQDKGCTYIPEFCNIIKDELDQALSQMKSDGLRIEHLWGQRYGKSSYMSMHTHGSVGYSAVIYVEFKKGIHTATRFMSPIHNARGEIEYYEPEVDEGDLLIFPSFLYHDALPNVTENNRTIFSFNFCVR